jgi:hypothetical protein
VSQTLRTFETHEGTATRKITTVAKSVPPTPPSFVTEKLQVSLLRGLSVFAALQPNTKSEEKIRYSHTGKKRKDPRL